MYAVPLTFPWDVANFGLTPLGMDPSGIDWMRATGAKDDNDKEMYEGDILLITHASEVDQAGDCDIVSSHVRMDWNHSEMGFMFASREVMESCDSIKIVGNIYENPELLNKL